MACSLIAFAGQSFANTTPIKFAKGSFCGSFSGNAKGRTFTLNLNANQQLFISSNNIYADTLDVTVKNPHGQVMPAFGLRNALSYDTDVKGKYTVKINPARNHINLEFCVP
ncbi:hypothetical protein [Moraxella sp.]|uniref:hypothetical protein n=1 Tax=Moraxella sp. TaxID=479 RepID=UPI0026DB26C2|nr:hypothetical protein [Moraxella sp.]MDO4895523.1 hypothetical protein [Moraxella sp.]